MGEEKSGSNQDFLVCFCIKCGREFYPIERDAVLCHRCGGPEELVSKEGPGRSFISEDQVPAEWNEGDIILDLYEVRGILGEGGMGKVYRVHHRNWKIDLAVKSPKPDSFETERQKETFVHECETWIDLGLHPNTVSCYYVRTMGGIPRVFADLVEGGSLHDWIRDRRLYDGGPEKALERMLDIAIQFAWGLEYAQEQTGQPHQDVKPKNVMMAPDGTAKVTDFGLVRARGATGKVLEETGVPQPEGSVLAAYGGMTPPYCSPEQAGAAAQAQAGVPLESRTRLTRRTDIWSWGLSVLEMFKGERTWEWGQTASHVLDIYLEEGPETEGIPLMPDALIELLRQCFQKEPEIRPHDFGIMASTLQGFYQKEIGQPYPREKPKAAELRADSLNNKALTMLDLWKEKEAVAAWEQALMADPHHPEATYNLGLWRWRKAQLTDEELLQQLKSISSLSDDWRPKYLLGLIHLERGDGWAAKATLRKVLQVELAESDFNKAQARLKQAETIHGLRTLKGNAGEVHSIAISPDGRYVVSGSDDKTLQLWELETGRCLRIFEGHKRSIFSVAISPDGKHIISGSADNTVRIWNLKSGQCLKILKGHGERKYSPQKGKEDPFSFLSVPSVNTVAITPNGRYVLSGADDETVRLWEFKSGDCLRIFKGHTSGVQSIAISPDGRFFISGSEDTTLRLWELETGRCIRIFEGHKGGVSSVAITSDGSYVVSGSADRTLRLWELLSGNCIRIMEGYLAQRVSTVAIAPDGQYALSGNEDTTVRLWELKSGRCVCTLEVHKGSVTSVAITSDGCFVLSGSRDETLRIWRLYRMRADWALNRPINVSHLTRTTATVLKQKEIALAKLKGGLFSEAGAALRRALSTPGFERDPRLLELWHQTGISGGRRIGLRLCRCLRIEDIPDRGKFKTFGNVIAISPNGKYAVLGTLSHTVQLWDLKSGRCVRILKGHKDIVSAIAITLDGRYALSGSWDGTIRLWDLDSGTCLHILTGHEAHVNAIAVSPDLRYVLSGSELDLRMWHLKSGRCMREFDWHEETEDELNNVVAFSPDLRYAVLGGDSTIRLMDIANETCLRVFEGHGNLVTAIAPTPDMRYLVSGSYDNTVRFWEVENGTCLGTFRDHNYPVKAVAITPDGRYALSGSEDYTLRLWDLFRKENLYELEGHGGAIDAVAFTPDAHYVVSAGGVTLRHWELDWDYEFPESAEWEEGARRYLDIFLTLHCPYGLDGISRVGGPVWSDEDFKMLLKELQYRGYGWLRPEGVRRELEKMTKKWKGPPPLLGK